MTRRVVMRRFEDKGSQRETWEPKDVVTPNENIVMHDDVKMNVVINMGL